MSKKKFTAIVVPVMALLAILMAVVIALCFVFRNTLSMYFGKAASNISQETLGAGAQLTEDIVEEGTVLLKNEKDAEGVPALPLRAEEIAKVNVFGWAAYDWMTSTFGSGFSNTSLEKIKLFPALKEAGIEYNETLYNMYEKFYSSPVKQWGMTLDEYRGDVEVGTTRKFVLHEPGAGFYTPEILEEAGRFSSVALVVIGRTGGEAADLRMEQMKQPQTNGSNAYTTVKDRAYLQLSVEEGEMIEAAKRACDKVIVLLNTSNTMEVGFLDDPGIDAALLVGLTGLTGVRSVIDILRGADEEGNPVTPSGRTADTYAYAISTAPSSFNSGYGGALKYTGLSTSNNYQKGYYDAYIDYSEGIYVGYRWYETAAVENYLNYEETVQYPFGYGLSYTTFEWSVEKIEINGKEQRYGHPVELGKDDVIELTVSVTNTGDAYGKEVVELYYTAPYTKGGIEKSHVVLADFAKTGLLAPGETGIVNLTVSARGMASYDAQDRNENGHAVYELDGGEYLLRLMKNSHEPATMSEDSRTESVISYSVPTDGYVYLTDEATGEPIVNRFTRTDADEELIDGYPIDGSLETTPVSYLSRADFEGTFPHEKSVRSINPQAQTIAKATVPTEEQLAATGYADLAAPNVGKNNGYTLQDMEECDSYDDPEWQELVEQITTSELINMLRDGFFKTAKIDSVGKPMYWDYDGPLGINTRVTSNVSCTFVSYPSETLLAQTWNPDLAYALGMSVGTEARESDTGIRGWYGPAANIHRNPYGGRNAEYYSEDALLSGRMTAETVRGAKNMGLHCYIKHFVANDSESLREGLFTFLTEQTLREIYLKPFEIAVKEGGANALMTSMNRLGATWSGASYALCTEILRGEWGFRGSLVTDWVDSGTTYMTDYKGIWAGNDIWLNNPEYELRIFTDRSFESDPVFLTLAQKAAHNVLWTYVDTERARIAYDPDADTAGSFVTGGASFDRTWVWFIPVPVCGALLIAEGVLTFFLVRKLRKGRA